MKKLFALVVAGIAMSLAVPALAAVKSGLEEGASPPPFHVLDVTGPSKGKKLCYRCQYGGKPVVSIFARDVDEKLATLIKKTDQFVGKNKDWNKIAPIPLLVRYYFGQEGQTVDTE